MLEKKVFALPGCQRMSVKTILCDAFRGRQRATTNVQNGLVFSFYSLLFSKEKLLLRESPEGKSVEKCENVSKSVEKCGKVWKSADTILLFSCCPLVFL